MATDLIDLVFPVRGSCVHAGYQYSLYSAVKQFDTGLATDDRVWIGPLVNVRGGPRGMLWIDRGSEWMLRLPLTLAPRALAMAGIELRIGDCILTPHSPTISGLALSTTLHCEALALTRFKVGRGFPDDGRFAHAAPIIASEIAGIIGRSIQVEVGLRRALSMKGQIVHWTYPAVVRGLTEAESERLQTNHESLARKHCGCSLWVAGEWPRWIRDG